MWRHADSEIQKNQLLNSLGTKFFSITPRKRIFLEKLTRLQLAKKFPAFYGTAFTSACVLSLSWASSIQPMPPHLTSWRSILISSSRLRLGLTSGLVHSGFPTKTLNTYLHSPIRATCPAHLILLGFITWAICIKTTDNWAPHYIVYVCVYVYMCVCVCMYMKVKGKVFPLQARCGPEDG